MEMNKVLNSWQKLLQYNKKKFLDMSSSNILSGGNSYL